MAEKIHKFYTEDLAVRVSVATTTEIVQTFVHKQKTHPLPTIVSGQALTGALLMASQLNTGQRVGLHFRGDGPMGWFYTEASFESEARGYCSNPKADIRTADGRLDFAAGIGAGILTVTRSTPFQKQPHVGIVPLVSGDVSQNIAHYLYQSHQIPSVVSLTVSLDKAGDLLGAGGVLIEVLPGATDSLLAMLEMRSQNAGPLSQRIQAGESPKDIAAAYTHGSPLQNVDHPFTVVYACRCEQERAQRAISFLGKETLEEMVKKGSDVKVTCEFCGQGYKVSIDELRFLLAPPHMTVQ